MDWLTAPVVFGFSFVTALTFGFLVQRMLGIRIGPVRLLLAGVLALFVTQPILLAITDGVRADITDGRALWFLLLAGMCTIPAGMAFLVVSEAFVPYGSVPLPQVWGRGLRGRWARSRRYWQIVRIVFRHGLGPYLSGRRRRALTTPAGRAEFGRRLVGALNDGGVTFVKIGQILATRRDLLPAEIVDELRSLQDDAEPVPWPQISAVIDAELGRPLSEVFDDIEADPLAAASVGQVHSARLRSGQLVVVKVRRPGIADVVERDLDIAFRLAGRLEVWTRWAGPIGATALADGLAGALREELDYRIEAANIRAVAESAAYRRADRIRIPDVDSALSGPTVLVMQRMVGTKFADAGPLLDQVPGGRAEVARHVLDFLVHQVVLDGLFHADPHPGNILLLADGSIGLLDFGSVGRLDQALRRALQRMLAGMDAADPFAVSDALLEVARRPEEVDDLALERDLGRFLARYVVGGTAAVSGTAQMFGQLFRIVSSHRLTVPPELAAVFRMLATVEGTLVEIAPDFDVVTETRAIAGALMIDSASPTALKQAALEELSSLAPILRRFPRRLERIADAAEHGRFAVGVRVLAGERERAAITGLVHQAVVAFLAATTGIMAALLLGADGGPMMAAGITLFQFIGYNLLVISFILGLRAIAPVFRRGAG